MGEIVIRQESNAVALRDGTAVFGEVEEITSRAVGAERTNIVKVTLWGPDILHHHEIAEETYICSGIGNGELFIDGKIIDFTPGTRVIIKPGQLHAARPKEGSGKIIFLCVSSPAFNPADVFEDPRRRNW